MTSPTAPKFTAVKDSGVRQEFSTGSVRDTSEGKGRFDLMSPIVMRRDAQHFENGAKKYGDRNWEKGQPLGRFLDSAIRHLNTYLEGHRDEDHLAAARWNIACMIHVEEMISRGLLPKELDDLPSYISTPSDPPTSKVKSSYWGSNEVSWLDCYWRLEDGNMYYNIGGQNEGLSTWKNLKGVIRNVDGLMEISEEDAKARVAK